MQRVELLETVGDCSKRLVAVVWVTLAHPKLQFVTVRYTFQSWALPALILRALTFTKIRIHVPCIGRIWYSAAGTG